MLVNYEYDNKIRHQGMPVEKFTVPKVRSNEQTKAVLWNSRLKAKTKNLLISRRKGKKPRIFHKIMMMRLYLKSKGRRRSSSKFWEMLGSHS